MHEKNTSPSLSLSFSLSLGRHTKETVQGCRGHMSVNMNDRMTDSYP